MATLKVVIMASLARSLRTSEARKDYGENKCLKDKLSSISSFIVET